MTLAGRGGREAEPSALEQGCPCLVLVPAVSTSHPSAGFTSLSVFDPVSPASQGRDVSQAGRQWLKRKGWNPTLPLLCDFLGLTAA